MTYERKQINSAPRGPVKPSRNRSGLIRAIRRIKPSPAYLQGMQEWRDRVVRELGQEVVQMGQVPVVTNRTLT
jgi:hypothetical protein